MTERPISLFGSRNVATSSRLPGYSSGHNLILQQFIIIVINNFRISGNYELRTMVLSYTRDSNAHYSPVPFSTDSSSLSSDKLFPAQTELISPRKRQKTSSVVLRGSFDLVSADLPSNIQLTGHLEWERLRGQQQNIRQSALFQPQPTAFNLDQPMKENSAVFRSQDRLLVIHSKGVKGPNLGHLEPIATETTSREFLPSSQPLPSLTANSTTRNHEKLDFSPLLSPAHIFQGEHGKADIIPDSPKTETKFTPEATQGASTSSRVIFHSKIKVRYFVPPLEAAGITSPENRKRVHGVRTHRHGALTYSRLYVWITGAKKTKADRASRLIQTASLDHLAVIFKKGTLRSFWEIEMAFSLLVMGDFLSNPACLANTLYLPGLPHEKKQVCLKKLLGLIPLDGTEKWARKRKRRAC